MCLHFFVVIPTCFCHVSLMSLSCFPRVSPMFLSCFPHVSPMFLLCLCADSRLSGGGLHLLLWLLSMLCWELKINTLSFVAAERGTCSSPGPPSPSRPAAPVLPSSQFSQSSHPPSAQQDRVAVGRTHQEKEERERGMTVGGRQHD